MYSETYAVECSDDAAELRQEQFSPNSTALLKSRHGLHCPLTTLGPSARVMPPGAHATFVERGVNPAVVVPQQTLRLPR